MIRQWRSPDGGLRRPHDLFEEPRYSRRRAILLWLAISVGLWLMICGAILAVAILDPRHPVPMAL